MFSVMIVLLLWLVLISCCTRSKRSHRGSPAVECKCSPYGLAEGAQRAIPGLHATTTGTTGKHQPPFPGPSPSPADPVGSLRTCDRRQPPRVPLHRSVPTA